MSRVMLASEGAGGGMSTITAAISDVTTAVGTVWSTIIGNPFLTFCLAASVLGIAISVFAHIKSVAH